MKVLQQEMIHIVAGGWKTCATFSQRKKKKWKFLMYLTVLKEMFISEGEFFRNEFKKVWRNHHPLKITYYEFEKKTRNVSLREI